VTDIKRRLLIVSLAIGCLGLAVGCGSNNHAVTPVPSAPARVATAASTVVANLVTTVVGATAQPAAPTTAAGITAVPAAATVVAVTGTAATVAAATATAASSAAPAADGATPDANSPDCKYADGVLAAAGGLAAVALGNHPPFPTGAIGTGTPTPAELKQLIDQALEGVNQTIAELNKIAPPADFKQYHADLIAGVKGVSQRLQDAQKALVAGDAQKADGLLNTALGNLEQDVNAKHPAQSARFNDCLTNEYRQYQR